MRKHLIISYEFTGKDFRNYASSFAFSSDATNNDELANEILEAAKIEGASHFRIFWNIMLPLSKPAIATVGTLSFIGSWNDYIWPLMVLTNTSDFPLQVAITNINNTQPTYTNQIMAMLTISTIPLIIIYVFFQKYLVQGLGSTGTGVK